MEKLRYNRSFKKGIAALIFCFLLFGSLIAYSVVAKIQYDNLASGMKPVEATVVDIDWVTHYKGPNEQEIYITYEVNGEVYNRELKTDTALSFSAGRGTHYSIGDKIEILYDPQNPGIIASRHFAVAGYFCFALGVFSLGVVLMPFIYMIKHSREFLVTQEGYEKEGEELKRNKLEAKKQKQKKRFEKKQKKAKLKKIFKIILIVLAVPLGVFIIFLLFGALLMALGY
jgi:hypothetical protein